MQFSISQGRSSIFRGELPGKITHLVKTAQFSDRLHFMRSGDKKELRFLQAELPQVFFRCGLQYIFETPHTLRVADKGSGRDFTVADIFRKMLLHEQEHFFYAFLFLKIPPNGSNLIFTAVLPDLPENIRQAAAHLEFIAVLLSLDVHPALFDLPDHVFLPFFGGTDNHEGQ